MCVHLLMSHLIPAMLPICVDDSMPMVIGRGSLHLHRSLSTVGRLPHLDLSIDGTIRSRSVN